jgi:hypothetical protein
MVPDLVFSEMNFLQKRKGLHDATTPAESGKTRRMRDRPRRTEEEISAYFAPTRPPLEERDVNDLLDNRHHSLPQKSWPRLEDPQRDVSASSLTQPSIEPSER